MENYKLKLIINNYMYYVNELEADENNNVIIKDKKGNIISNNYFAYADFIEQLEKIIEGSATYEYIDEKILSQAKEYINS